jgi:hypothetical protein
MLEIDRNLMQYLQGFSYDRQLPRREVFLDQSYYDLCAKIDLFLSDVQNQPKLSQFFLYLDIAEYNYLNKCLS